MAKRLGLLLGILILGAGCDFEPVCAPLVYNRATDLCECPMGAPYDPDSGGCILPDGGVIPVDGGGDAGTPPMDACTPVPESCNGVDDDCDGTADEAAAAAACEAVPGATGRTCTAGECVVVECASGRDDCNREYADGCEAELATDDAHCGGCGLACEVGRVCVDSSCLRSPATHWVRTIEGAGAVSSVEASTIGGTTVLWGSSTGASVLRGVMLDSSLDAFVLAMDRAGEPIWLVQPGGPESTILQAVATPDGGAFVCGLFESRLLLGDRELIANAASSGFVARIDGAGSVGWITRVSSDASSVCRALVIHSGAPHIALEVDAGAVTIGTMPIAVSTEGALIVRFEPESGAPSLRASIESSGYADVTALTSGHDALYFGGIIAGATRFSPTVEHDATGGYVAALDEANEIAWLAIFRSGFFAPPASIVALPSGTLVVGGYFYERVSIEGRDLRVAAEMSGAYVARLDAATGASTWQAALAATLVDLVPIGAGNDALAVARYQAPLTIAGETRSPLGASDCALLALRGDTLRWMASLGSSAGAALCSSASANGSSIVLAGTITGPIETGVVSIPHSAGEDGFVWRFRAR